MYSQREAIENEQRIKGTEPVDIGYGEEAGICPLCGMFYTESDADYDDVYIINGYFYCKDCLKRNCDYEVYERYIEEKELQSEFSLYVSEIDLLRYFRLVINKQTASKQAQELYGMVEDFCWEEADEFIKWYASKEYL